MTVARRRALVALAFASAAALLTFLLAGAHQQREATRRLDAANAAFVKGQWRAAADEAHAAALRAWPRSDAQREAFELMEHTARSAKTGGDAASALVAWTEMRHAAIAVRGIACDTSAWQREADEGVRASGGTATEPPGDAGGGPPSQALRLATGAAVLLAALAITAASSSRRRSTE